MTSPQRGGKGGQKCRNLLSKKTAKVTKPSFIDDPLGTFHIFRHHIFGIFGPPSPLRQHVFST